MGGRQLLRKAGPGQGHVFHRQQAEFVGQLGLQPLAHQARVLPFGHLQIHPFPLGLGPKGQGQGELKPRQGVEATGETHGQAAAAQGPLQHPHQIEVTEQAQAAGLGKAEAQALQPLTVGGPLGPLLGDRRWRDHHVVAQVRATDPAVAAALEGAIGHHGRGQGPLQVFG